MTIRKILVPVDGSEAARSPLEFAFRIASDSSAHVEVLHVRGDPRDAVPVLGEGMSGAMIEELISLAQDEGDSRAARAKAMFKTMRDRYSVPEGVAPSPDGASTAWLELTGREDRMAVSRARLADLVVMGRPGAEPDVPSPLTFNAALFESGRPVIIAPSSPSRFPPRRVAVAWSDSAEAARAVAAAMPILAQAESVIVLTAVTDETTADHGKELGDYLSWHGIASEQRAVSCSDGRVGAALLGAVGDVELLVMGAYSHSRLRQLILGGVTKHVLERSTLPVLVAH